MGCISSKEKSQSSSQDRVSRKGSIDRRVAHVNSVRNEDGIRAKVMQDNGEVKVVLFDKKKQDSNRFGDNKVARRKVIEKNQEENCGFDDVDVGQTQIEEKKMGKVGVLDLNHPNWGKVPKSLEAEQVAAGWPSWLASAAGEAIKGWMPRRANTFEKLDRIGQGTYSSVYKARNITSDKLVALKKVRFDKSDADSVKFMAREIVILRRLDHPNIIKLEGLITSQSSSTLYLVFEYMEHDLMGLASLPNIKFTESQIKCYMKQLLTGLDHCHSRGVLHRDIKGSNLLIDDNGILKIADFGLSSFYDPQGNTQLTSRVVTLWYRAPELLLGATRYEVAVDLWSAGCILGELLTGKPILPGRTEVEQLHKIFKLCGSPSDGYWVNTKLPHSSVIKPRRPYRRCLAETFKDFPASAVALMDTLLSMDPTDRGTADLALKSEYFTTKPFACDPSTLPKYPPSKEIDIKMLDEEARRQVGSRRAGTKHSQGAQLSDANSEVAMPWQRSQNSDVNNRSQMMINTQKEKTFSGFLIDPSKPMHVEKEKKGDAFEYPRRKVSHSGPLVHGAGWREATKDVDNPHIRTSRNTLSSISGIVAARGSLHDDHQEKPGNSRPEVARQPRRYQGMSGELESSRKQPYNFERHKAVEASQAGDVRYKTRESSLHGRGPRGNKIYVSGPLLVPSNNVEEMLKEHDRQIQEFARRRLEKTNVGGKQATWSRSALR